MEKLKNFFSKDWFNYKYNLRLYIREFFACILEKIISKKIVRNLIYCHTKYTILDFSKLDYIVYENTNMRDIIAEESENQIF